MSSGVIICPICLEKIGEAESKPRCQQEVLNRDLPSTSSSNTRSSAECNLSPFLRQSQRPEAPKSGRVQIQVIQCGHIFHSTCLQDWMSEGKSDCPTCRRIFNSGKILTIYPQFLNSDKSSENLDLPQNVQHHFKRTINYCLETIQTTICRLEENMGKMRSSGNVSSQRNQFPTTQQTAFVPTPSITNAPDRIAEMLRSKNYHGALESSLEKEIVDLKNSIEAVNHKMNDYGEKVGQLTDMSSPKDKKVQKELMESLSRINRLVLEDQALNHSLNKKICQLKSKTSITLLNDECNRLCSALNSVISKNYKMHADIQIILQGFDEIKKLVGKILENSLCL